MTGKHHFEDRENSMIQHGRYSGTGPWSDVYVVHALNKKYSIFLPEIILVDEIRYLFISCGYTYSGIEREFSQAQLVYLWDLPRSSPMA